MYIQAEVGMPEVCPQCQLHNTTLHWHDSSKGFICLGCFYGRRDEQKKLDLKFDKIKATLSKTI